MTTEAQPVAAPPGGDLSPAARLRSTRSATRAALESGNLDDAPAEAKPAAAKPPNDSPSPAEPKGSDNAEADESADADDASGKPAPAPDAKADKPDPETARRLGKVQEAEKRSREKLAAERAEFDKDRAAHAKAQTELEAQRAELAAYKKAQERAKVDPVAYLRAAGVTDPADLDYAARAAYAAGKGDPANKEAAARSMREREADDDRAAMRREIAELREERNAEKKAAATERQASEYAGRIMKASETSPLAKAALAKDHDGTHDDLSRIYTQLYRETGDAPDPEDVLARFEKDERRRLARYGADPDSLLTTPPKTNSPPAGKKPPAPTLGNDLSTPSVPRPRSSERASRAETRKLLEEGRLD